MLTAMKDLLNKGTSDYLKLAHCNFATHTAHTQTFSPHQQHARTQNIKAIPLQAWTSPEGSRRLRLSDFKTIGT